MALYPHGQLSGRFGILDIREQWDNARPDKKWSCQVLLNEPSPHA